MSIGKNRHYIVSRIAPRHFLQTAALCAIPQASAKAMLEELGDSGPDAIDNVLADLPDGFPERIAAAIADAAKARLAQIGSLAAVGLG